MGLRLPVQVDGLLHCLRSPRRLGLVAVGCLFAVYILALTISPAVSEDSNEIGQPDESKVALSTPCPALGLDTSIPYLRDARNPGKVIASPQRAADVVDAFQNFTRYAHCNVSSLELHDPFEPLCADKESLLVAMTGGGRSGIDMPYMPRGCDMRWFHTDEICALLSRFSKVSVVGDSMMRNLALALHTFLRKDLNNGTTKSWNNDPQGIDCHCANAFGNNKCWLRGAWSSREILNNDPSSLWCPPEDTARIEYNVILKWPINKSGEEGLIKSLPKEKPPKPHVFLFGHSLWNDVNSTASNLWLKQVQGNINKTMPWVTEPEAVHPRLFITPSCSGGGKPEKYLKTQGNPQLGRFELFMGPKAKAQGVDHLGVFNLTMQNTTPDGTHAGMHANLVKAMMVLNWLSMVDISNY